MAHKNSHSAPRKKGGALKIVLVLLVLLLVVAGGCIMLSLCIGTYLITFSRRARISS